MEKYGSGTRVLLAGRSRSDIVYQTTVGSPVRYDAAVVSGCVQLPNTSNDGTAYCQVPIVGPRTSITNTPLFSNHRYLNGGVTGNTAVTRLMEWVRPSGQVVARLMNANTFSSSYKFQIFNGSTFIDAGPAFSIGSGSLSRINTKLIPGVGGELTAWLNGAQMTSTIGGLNANFDEIGFVRFYNPSSAVGYISEYGLANEDLRSYSFGSDAITGAGFYNDGTGAATDTGDDSLNTFKGLPANGNKYTGTTAARTLPGNTAIESVMLSSVMRTASPIGNAKALLRIGGADSTSASISPVPSAGFEHRMPYFDTNPATGLAWTIADYNAAEKGNEAAT
jgi:hypothetical protein